MRLVDLYFDRQNHLAFERTVVDLHRQQSHGSAFVVLWLGQLARAPNQHSLRLDSQVDPRPLDAGKIDTNSDAGLAAIGIDRRLPGMGRELKLRPRQLVRDVVQRAVEPAQLDAVDRVYFNKTTPLSIIATRSADSMRVSFEHEGLRGYLA